jgi:hypothetical protein
VAINRQVKEIMCADRPQEASTLTVSKHVQVIVKIGFQKTGSFFIKRLLIPKTLIYKFKTFVFFIMILGVESTTGNKFRKCYWGGGG